MRKYKYQINHYLSIQPKHISIDQLALRLRKDYDIPFPVFDRDRHSRTGEAYEIPEERLKIYAELFNIPVRALIEESLVKYGGLKQKKVAPVS